LDEVMMEEFLTIQQIDEAAGYVREHSRYSPEIGMILGSGLGDLAEMVAEKDIIPTASIPHWPESTVLGHQGRLVLGKLGGQTVLVLQGRTHYYEGYQMDQVTLPVRVMQRLGIHTLVVTNAAGGISPDFTPGDVMLIVDHINMIGMGGLNPLRGPNLAELGERFPDMSQPYDRDLIALARQAANAEKVELREGVYVCLAGPSFESPADLRFLKTAGADAVGMSTVPEVIVARHGKMRVLGFSGISNKANLDGSTITTHAEVLEAGKMIVPKLKSIILNVLSRL
jgi:purine-nucleoside phosphorylase